MVRGMRRGMSVRRVMRIRGCMRGRVAWTLVVVHVALGIRIRRDRITGDGGRKARQGALDSRQRCDEHGGKAELHISSGNSFRVDFSVARKIEGVLSERGGCKKSVDARAGDREKTDAKEEENVGVWGREGKQEKVAVIYSARSENAI